MKFVGFTRSSFRNFGLGVSLFSTMFNLVGPPSLAAQTAPAATTPIQHVIIIIGENRSFDHVYATYKPKHGQKSFQSALPRHRQCRRNARTEYLESAQYSAVDTTEFDLAAQTARPFMEIFRRRWPAAQPTASDTARRRSLL